MNFISNAYNRKYLGIAMPASLESVFMILLASADLIMVGSLGTAAVAAVSIFLQPRLILLCAVRSMASAVTLLSAERYGAGDIPALSDILRKSLLLCLLAAGALHAVFFLFLREILSLMGAEAEYLSLALDYGRIAVISVYITSLYTVLQATQLGMGKTATILRTNIIGNIVNIVCNVFLIFGIGPFPALGVTGAAIGTVIGTTVTLLLTWHDLRRDSAISFAGAWRPDKSYFKRFTPVFSSVFAEQGAERIGMVLFARMAAGLGTVPFAVHSICMNICDIYYDFALGLGKASMVLAGQTRGAGDKEGWRRYKKIGTYWGLFFATLGFILVAVFRNEIFGIYSGDADALAMAGTVMFIMALVSFPETHMLVVTGILRGSGHTRAVALWSFFLITILRPAMTAVFLYVMDWGLIGLWAALAADQCIRAVCFSAHLRRVKM